MQALTLHLHREAELNPQASYYNVGLLKYQVSVNQKRGTAETTEQTTVPQKQLGLYSPWLALDGTIMSPSLWTGHAVGAQALE